MKTITKFGLLLALIAITNSSFATKVVKHRDHWGIFGGYKLIRECKSETSEGPRIDVYCEGSGDMRCKADMDSYVHDNGYETTAPENALVETLHDFAATQATNEPTGAKSESITICYANGATITYVFDLTWYIDANNILVSEVDIH